MLKSLIGPFVAYAAKLRFPTLFKITAVLFLFDLFVPDMVPFIDELILGLGAALLASWKAKKAPANNDNATH